MKKLLAILLSIIIHLTLIYFILTIDFEIHIEDKKESLNIVIKKKESRSRKSQNKSTKSIEEVRNIEFNQPLDKPESSNYISTNDISPVIDFNEMLFDKVVNIKKDRKIDSFEKSLEELMPDITQEIVTEYEESVSFSWYEDSRFLKSSINIDFDKFPKTSFTGIDISIEFKVSERGDVYDVKVIPPGSGSIDFDILMVEYITNLKFEPGESASSGEIKIIYE